MKTLSPELMEKARIEVREDDNRRQQALEQFREWIHKHPWIKRIEIGWSIAFYI